MIRSRHCGCARFFGDTNFQMNAEHPTLIGEYAIERRLALTNFSEVFIATSPSGKRVCIKRLLPKQTNSALELSLKFRREATLLATVAHANVVRVFEIGEFEGEPFICQELIDGRSLETLVRSGPLSVLEVIDLLQQMALGLAQVHAHGVIHADLKPANVLLNESAAGRVVKLVDFGLAVQGEEAGGSISGTPHYMSPEQTRLVDWPVDHRSDLYSLGVVGFELLTGGLPFDAPDLPSLLQNHVSLSPPLPSDRRTDTPPLLESILLKLLKKIPADRYRSAQSLVADLLKLSVALKAGDANPQFPLDVLGAVSTRVGQVFVGRDTEIVELSNLLVRAGEGHPSIAFVGGNAGVGKSALIKEYLNRSLTTGARFAIGKCFEFSRALPYYVWTEALDDFLARLMREPEAARNEVIARLRSSLGALGTELVKLAPAFSTIFPDAKAATVLGEGRDRLRLLSLFARLLEAMGTPEHPIVLVLDDLQWADTASIGVLETVLGALARSSVLILATFRDEEVAANPGLGGLLKSAAARSTTSRLDLKPLDRPRTALLVAESLRQPLSALPSEVIDVIHHHTQGTPLFVNEVLKALLDSQVLEVVNGRLIFSSSRLQTTNLPSSVVEMVLQRVSIIEPEIKETLGAAALLGRSFDFDQLTEASGAPADVVFSAVQRGLSEKMLQPYQQTQYQFCHDRIREVCTKLISQQGMQAVHARMMKRLERVHAGAANGDWVFELAEHASGSGDARCGWRYCGEAATLAERCYANDQALSYLARSIEHGQAAGLNAQELFSHRLRRAGLLAVVGKYGESLAEYEEVLAQSADPLTKGTVLLGKATVLQNTGNYTDGDVCLRRAAESIGFKLEAKAGAWRVRLRYLFWQAVVRVFGPRRRTARADLLLQILTRRKHGSGNNATGLLYPAYAQLAEAVKFGPSALLASAHSFVGIALMTMPKPAPRAGLKHTLKSVEIARALGAQLEMASNEAIAGGTLVWATRYPEALAHLTQARELLTSLGDMFSLANVYIFSYLAYRGCGRFAEAHANARALLELGERISAFGSIANAHGKMGEVLSFRGDQASGAAHLEKSLELAESRKLNLERFTAWRVQGVLKLYGGAYAEARASFQKAISLAETPGVSIFKAYVSEAYLWHAEAILLDEKFIHQTGGLEGAPAKRAARDIRRGLKVEQKLGGHLGHAHRAMAALNWRQGRLAASRREIAKALKILHQQGRPFDVALGRFTESRLLSRVDAEAATVAMRRARHAFERQRLAFFVRACDRALADLNAPEQSVERSEIDQVSREASQKELELLSASARSLSELSSIDLLLAKIVEFSISLLGAERGFVFGRPGDGVPARVIAGRAATGAQLRDNDAQVSQGVIERVFSSGVGLATSDAEGEADLRERRSVVAYGLRSILCVCLRHEAQTFGVIYLDNQLTQAVYGKRELELLNAFAAQAAIALANISQLHELEARTRELNQHVLERTRQLEQTNLELDRAMNELTNTRLRLAEAQRGALEKELEIARTLYGSISPPAATTQLGTTSVVGRLMLCEASGGGECWAHARTPQGALLFVGSARGQGVGSAIVASVAHSCIETLQRHDARSLSPARVADALKHVIGSMGEQVSMSALILEVDEQARKLRYLALGHVNAYLAVRAGGSVLQPLHRPSSAAAGLGVAIAEVDYRPGDRLILWSHELEGPLTTELNTVAELRRETNEPSSVPSDFIDGLCARVLSQGNLTQDLMVAVAALH